MAVKREIKYKSVTGARGKKTTIGHKNTATSTMNKHKRRSHKKYRGQGK